MNASEISQLESKIIERLAARQSAMESDLDRFVAIPTGTGHENGLAKFRSMMRDRLERLGAAIDFLDGDPSPTWIVQPGQSASLALPPCLRAVSARTSGPRVLITGHLDTVHDPAGAFQSLTRTSLTRAEGPGAIDMKGGLVTMLHALEVLAECDVHIGWTVLLNSDEETGSFHSGRAIRAVAREHAAHGGLGFAMEPALPDGSVIVERLGSATFRLECIGKAAHAGRDFAQGVSAVNALAARILDAAKLVDLRAGTVVNIGPLEGASATNIVAPRARAWGNARFKDAAHEARVLAGLRALESAPDAPLPHTRLEYELNRPAKPSTAAMQALAQRVIEIGALVGETIGTRESGGVSDGNLMQAEGLPTLDTMGPRGGNLHRTDEFIELDSMAPRAAMLALALLRSQSGAAGLG